MRPLTALSQRYRVAGHFGPPRPVDPLFAQGQTAATGGSPQADGSLNNSIPMVAAPLFAQENGHR